MEGMTANEAAWLDACVCEGVPWDQALDADRLACLQQRAEVNGRTMRAEVLLLLAQIRPANEQERSRSPNIISDGHA
jgi:hypothetical protein